MVDGLPEGGLPMSELISSVLKVGRRDGSHFGILPFCLLLLTLCGVARAADHIVQEVGREMLAPDGRTLIDKQEGFSIVLPAPDWKVFIGRHEPSPDDIDAGFILVLAPPDGVVRLRLHGKIYPVPMDLERMHAIMSKPEPRVRAKRTEIVEVAGTKCLENEQESQGGRGWLHSLGRLCDAGLGRQFSVEIYPEVPVDRWPAEKKVLRELVESFRVLQK